MLYKCFVFTSSAIGNTLYNFYNTVFSCKRGYKIIKTNDVIKINGDWLKSPCYFIRLAYFPGGSAPMTKRKKFSSLRYIDEIRNAVFNIVHKRYISIIPCVSANVMLGKAKGVCCAVYGTVHYKEPFKSFE